MLLLDELLSLFPVSPLDPQEIHGAQFGDILKCCPFDRFHKLKTEKANEVICFEQGGRTLCI